MRGKVVHPRPHVPVPIRHRRTTRSCSPRPPPGLRAPPALVGRERPRACGSPGSWLVASVARPLFPWTATRCTRAVFPWAESRRATLLRWDVGHLPARALVCAAADHRSSRWQAERQWPERIGRGQLARSRRRPRPRPGLGDPDVVEAVPARGESTTRAWLLRLGVAALPRAEVDVLRDRRSSPRARIVSSTEGSPARLVSPRGPGTVSTVYGSSPWLIAGRPRPGPARDAGGRGSPP